VFGAESIECDVTGNVLTNVAFLHGLGAAELTDAEYKVPDPYFPVLTGLRAVKRAGAARAGARGAVLLYHRVDDVDDVHGLAVPRRTFDAHMEWLQAHCTLMPLDQLLSSPVHHLPERAVAVSFDDGYVDTLRHAVPVLQQRQVPATFFLTSRWLERPGEYWWDTLERVLLRAGALPEAIDLRLASAAERFETATIEQRTALHWRLHEWLVHATLPDRERIVGDLATLGGGSTGDCRPMVADEVRQLANLPGVTIGAHTVNHLSLPDQPDDVCRREIDGCRTALRRAVGRPIDLFAYPYGAVDRVTAALVRESWHWGLGCEEHGLGDGFDAARVPRLDVKQWSVTDLASRVDRLLGARPGDATTTTR
jgi:peptidoglycan/xylan/chitin deacetylase (PgdA/CDA1 family)